MLSASFRTSCAACHGGAGEGKGPYPKIPGTLTEAAFIEKVRSGSANMPKFGVDFVTDAQLKSDFSTLGKLSGALTAGSLAGGEWSWNAAQVDDLYSKGLAMWRKPGTVDGQACTNCHAPDGIDLAFIGFRDDAILRRAHKHLIPADALAVRDFIHVQRRRFGLKQVCSTDWRPFQPTGEVLPGRTADEREGAFLEAMKKKGLLLFVGKIVTVDDARKAWAELQTLDLRQIPIPTPLPRWTEDRFNGPEHRTNNDYMPPLPTIPNNPADFHAKEDAYLNNPTDAGLLQLLAMQRKEANDGNYSGPKNTGPAWFGCGHSGGKVTFLIDYLTQNKRGSVIFAQHLFRMKLLGKATTWDRQLPEPGTPPVPNPMWQIGQRNAEPSICAGGFNNKSPVPELLATLTPDVRAELTAKDVSTDTLSDLSHELADPWLTLGNLFDQAFVTTTPAGNPFNYWALVTFPHKVFFLPFMYTHRRAVQAKQWELYGKASGFPTNALLDGSRSVQYQRKIETPVPFDELQYPSYGKTGADANRMKGNIVRMTLLLQRDLLQKGGAVFEPGNLRLDHFTSFSRMMKLIVKDPIQAPIMKEPALYTTDIDDLVREVEALVAKAPQAVGRGPS